MSLLSALSHFQAFLCKEIKAETYLHDSKTWSVRNNTSYFKTHTQFSLSDSTVLSIKPSSMIRHISSEQNFTVPGPDTTVPGMALSSIQAGLRCSCNYNFNLNNWSQANLKADLFRNFLEDDFHTLKQQVVAALAKCLRCVCVCVGGYVCICM